MEYRKLGKSGLRISEVSIGAWLTYGGSVAQKESSACIHRALEHGINFIDCADVYANGRGEEFVGQAIKGRDRSKLVLSSKFNE